MTSNTGKLFALKDEFSLNLAIIFLPLFSTVPRILCSLGYSAPISDFHFWILSRVQSLKSSISRP